MANVEKQSEGSQSKYDEINSNINRIWGNISDDQEMVKKQHDKIRENTASITELELDFKSLANILLKVSKGMHYELALKVNLLNGILFNFLPHCRYTRECVFND